MASTRRPGGLGLNIRTSTQADERAANMIRAVAPWGTWAAMPVVGTGFYMLHKQQGGDLVPYMLHAGTVIVPAFVWKLRKSQFGRKYLAANAIGAMGWIDYIASNGWTWSDASVWAVGGFVGCLLWNIWHSHRHDASGEVFAAVDGKSGAAKQKAVNWAYLVRLITGRVPAIRSAANAASNVVPALNKPWLEQPAVAGGGTAKAELTAGANPDDDDPNDLAAAKAVTQAFATAYRKWTVQTEPSLNGTYVKWENIRPWRASGLIIGRPGVHEPQSFVSKRGLIASLSRVGPDRINIRPNTQDNSQARVDLVLKDVLASTPWWTPRTTFGGSVGDGGIVVGVFEDKVPLAIMQPALFDKDGSLIHNLSHLGVEGMTGSGKSTFARILVAEDFALYDVEDWAIDTAKGMQTLGPLAPGLPWLATKTKMAQAMVSWLVHEVIPARATYLARKGLDNWQKGCGIPFLRVLIEEAAVVANELGDLTKLANLARSAGVGLILSFQRAHHGLIDTNVRAALGSTLSFGQREFSDCFMLDEDVAAAGADPSVWKDKHPGKMFAQLQGFDVERMLTHARSFRVDTKTLTTYCGVRGPEHIAELQARFPDWYALLTECDSRGHYAKRQTGAMAMAALMGGAATLTGVPIPPVEGDRPAPARSAEPVSDGDEYDDGADGYDEYEDDMDRNFEMTNGDGARHILPDAEDDLSAAEAAELIGQALDSDDLPEEDRAALTGLLEDLQEEARTGESFASDEPINTYVHPDEMLDFARPDDDKRGLPKKQAQAWILQFLAHKGPGWEFTPADLHRETGERTGKGPSWTRGEVSGRLKDLGVIAHVQSDPEAQAKGLYEVTTKIHEFAAPAPAPVT